MRIPKETLMPLPNPKSHLEVLRTIGANHNTADIVFGNGGRSPEFLSREFCDLYMGFVLKSGDLSPEDAVDIFHSLRDANLREHSSEEEAIFIRDNLTGDEVTGLSRDLFEQMLEKMISPPGRKMLPPDKNK